MMVERERMTVWSFLKGAFKVVVGFSLLIQSLLFLVLLVALFGIIGGVTAQLGGKNEEGPSVAIENGVALVLNPKGTLTEVAPENQDPLASIFIGSPQEVAVHDLVRVVDAAREDDRIDALVLDLGGLYVPSIYASKAYYLADAIEAFRESGKRVVAIGDGYTQEQYLLASEADTILMHDYGQVFMTGYGTYRQYYASALEKLKVTSHVFRVGTFKSALEPYLRDDMSEAAELANKAFLDVLWETYTETVEGNRGLPAGSLDAFAQAMPTYLEAAGGDTALMVEQVGLVDQLAGRADQIAYVADIVGEDDEDGGFRRVGWKTYELSVPEKKNRKKVADVAIVTAAGAIVDGDQQGGVAAGDVVARQLRDARLEDDVKAVVLRVDSPGGSAFASEVIRDEVLKLKAAGKPVVVSMGSLAASGGYWISAPADEIWASPVTVTGSIGIFGYIPTFEDTAADLGVYTDGVGTTPLAAISGAGIGPLPEQFSQLMQLSIEEGYDRFLTIVADGRGMTKPAVDNVGQGRVWIGETGAEIGLVDKLGTIRDATASAAKLAGLDDYDVVGLTKEKTAFERFLEGLAGTEAKLAGKPAVAEPFVGGTGRGGAARQLAGQIKAELLYQASFNDPNAVYARCVACDPR